MAAQVIVKEDITDKRGGKFYCGSAQFNVEIRKNDSIRIYGIASGGRFFDRTFLMGDKAEYHSYNLSYYGPIVGIGEKTVTIKEPYGEGSRRHRLDLYMFCFRNWDFDVAEASKRNSEWSD